MDDGLTVAFGGSYDFSVVKVFAGARVLRRESSLA